ncbi:cysteine desulfurase family protein [Anaerosporobacter faecicola]|uniref:cysteine desulfurase family protein n=1 Tax=Anaerosporobacter faecicola TaxID=2718714 RepID=UPI00143C8490|nr:cysteine desulfurase family protein [Anaerosporobacter faecicola]
MVYLDYAANTPTDERVLAEFCEANQTYFGNPNSLHPLGFAAKEKMDCVTEKITQLLNLQEQEIIYTSGASESNNMAIKGIARTSRHIGKHIISSGLEHSSVSGTLTYLQEQGYEIDLVSVTKEGKIDCEHLRELLRKDTVLVTVCAVDSELGIGQPVEEIAKILVEYPNCHLHVDATQALGKVQYNFQCGDTISFTPHKFFGINGCGILLRRKTCIMEPLIHGGVSTTMYRSGTPVVAMAAAMEKAIELAVTEYEQRLACVRENNTYLRRELQKMESVMINSPSTSVPHILNISVPGIRGYEMQERLAEQGVCLSAKSACAVKKTPSKPVFLLTKDKKRAISSFRISMSHQTTKEELEEFLRCLRSCVEALNP